MLFRSPADGSESAGRALRCLYPRDRGTVIDLSEDLVMSAVFSDLVAVQQAIKNQAQREAQLKQCIQQHMGDATRAWFSNGQVSWQRSRDSKEFDLEALARDHPGLLEGYAKTKPGSRRFLVQT